MNRPLSRLDHEREVYHLRMITMPTLDLKHRKATMEGIGDRW
jgi:hypothetical protein